MLASTSGPLAMIPARYGSTRFPGKPLALLGGQTVICRVVSRVLRARVQLPVVVCTDDDRIEAEIHAHFSPFQADVARTSPDCHTGTDRLAQAVRARLGSVIDGRQIILNIQGDEPFVEAAHLDVLIELMARQPELKMGTLGTPIREEKARTDPNVVKMVLAQNGRALYFSRAPIPFDREKSGAPLLRHLGIYAYEANWLLEMASLPPSKLEEIEKLEQLRALEHGVAIGAAIVENVVPIAIDTPDDLKRAQAFLDAR